MKKIVKKTYLILPIPQGMKECLKLIIFTILKPIIKETDTYKIWKQARNDNKTPKNKKLKRIKNRDRINYIKQIQSILQKDRNNPNFVTKKGEPYHLRHDDVKHIAFYLPQYHPIPENDKWWGEGFTEWRNVAKAVPLFTGHFQPRLPGALGYYDLRIKETIKQQMDLARFYGIYGFCIYHYWFSGKKLIDTPLNIIYDNLDLDLPFCIMWANENWTRRWDGCDNEVLIAQEYEDGFEEKYIHEVAKYMRDPRYIKINGKPVVSIYRLAKIPDAKRLVKIWRDYCMKSGIGEIHILAVEIGDFSLSQAADEFGLDGFIEFPPHRYQDYQLPLLNTKLNIMNRNYIGDIISYSQIVESKKYLTVKHPKLHRGVTLAWDNTARNKERSVVFHDFTMSAFREWLKDINKYTINYFDEENRIVFINAWNEWAEGTYLEPDLDYGYAALDSVRSVLEENKGL